MSNLALPANGIFGADVSMEEEQSHGIEMSEKASVRRDVVKSE